MAMDNLSFFFALLDDYWFYRPPLTYLLENSQKPKTPKLRAPFLAPFSGSPSQVLRGRSSERLPRP